KDATAPADPVRDGYSFTGWDKPLTNITSVQTITAQYQAMTYLVKFVDHDGTQLKEETVEHGKDATAPADPVRDGYSFTGWDKPLTNITSVQTITAQYQAMTYLVKFVNHDGTQLKEETVEHGKDATAPTNPVRDGYSFTGWDKPLTNITSNSIITAMYEMIVVNQGNLFKVVKVSSDSSKIVIRVIMTGNPLSICSYDLRLFYPSSSLNLNTSNIIKMNGTVINYDEAGVIRLNYSSIKNIVVETTLMEIEFNVLSSTTFTFDIEVIEAVKINESYDAITVVANEEDLIVSIN
ncbi:MAG: InlB B-repeat-containing protein, partial [Bacilli bacterium]|nr:InlB B-repeat-containing protein [Bacilli bacterium]